MITTSGFRPCEEHATASPWQREPVPSEPLGACPERSEWGDEGKQSRRVIVAFCIRFVV